MNRPLGAAVLAAALASSVAAGARADELDGVFHFQTAKAAFTPVALGQFDVAPFVGEDARTDAGDLAERPGFRLRRARFGFAGTVVHELQFGVNAELAPTDSAQIALHDAWVAWKPAERLRLQGGFADVPFSILSSTDVADGALSERPLGTRAMAPFHQLGLSYQAALRRRLLVLDFGTFNAFQRTDHFYTGYVENPGALGNRFDGIALGGRISSEPLGPIGPTIQRFAGERTRLLISASDYVSFGGTKLTDTFNVGVLLHKAGLHVLADFTYALAKPKDRPTQASASTANTTSWALDTEAGYLFTAKRLSGGEGGGFGAFGINARFELVDPNTSVADQADNWALTGGLSVHLFENSLKEMIEYTHREERHGQSLKNDMFLLSTMFRIGARPLE